MAEYIYERHFTVEEANALIPRISILLLKLQEAMAVLEGQRKQAVEAMHLARTNGKGRHGPDDDGLELIRDIVGAIEGHGCFVKNFEDPLIDFPSIRDGVEVFLCWRMGEPEVMAWHPLDGGFAGRREL